MTAVDVASDELDAPAYRYELTKAAFHRGKSNCMVPSLNCPGVACKQGVIMSGGGPPSRGLFRAIYNNFMKSIRIGLGPQKENAVGVDDFGNKFYEIPADPSRGKRRPKRWFVPSTPKDLYAEIDPEWESWLRLRRDLPPTPEEIAQNIAVAQMKKINARRLAEERGELAPALTLETEDKKPAFPVLEDYEIVPGAGSVKETKEAESSKTRRR
ncbi:unnamed protein product [Cyprideis torosa]|uniref:Uncharacterized protein n=1 Tax=Cyprideis torosa TaxID=163714 RepID=A0A7R8WH82_9CRUS|nr:unnamed protein product [Cyprideis torosa]CAG0892979.1 unnamed protein product [Cyprideis torosa]